MRWGRPADALNWWVGLALVLVGLYVIGARLGLMWQISDSGPRGIYRLHALPPTLTHGLLVTLPVPDAVVGLVYDHGWLPHGVPLMKAVAAIGGDEVCISDSGVTINSEHQAPVYRDLGRVPLPVLRGCWTLGADEVFLLSTKIPNSMDSRYFGPVPLADLQAMATPLWTW